MHVRSQFWTLLVLHGVEGRARGVDKAGGAERTTQGRHGLQGRVEHAAQSRQQNSWHHGKQHACMNIAHTYQHNKQAQEDIAHSTHIRLDVALPPHPAVARERGPGKSETLTMTPRVRGVHHCIPIPLRVACANTRAGAVLLAPAEHGGEQNPRKRDRTYVRQDSSQARQQGP